MKNITSILKALIFIVFFNLTSSVFAQNIDTVYQNQIKEFTTDEKFLPESVLAIPDHSTIPSPLDYFGAIIGAPGKMHGSAEVYAYFDELAKTSPKLITEQIGTSEEGRLINLVTISGAKTIKNLEQYRNEIELLADPRKVDEEAAEQIIKNGKVVYYLNGAMHSTEMGSPETLMELAYRLVADESEEIKNILDNCIILINPVSEPDGRDKQVDWYYRYTINREEYDDGFPKSPPYWGKYVFHDNNRDGLQITQEITKAIYQIYFDWHPTIMLDLHESVPLLYISTGTGPYNENIDPITVGEWQTIANHEMTVLSTQGLPGAFNWAFYDGWWPGYGIWVANNHNSVGRFYETFGNAGANTYLRDISKSKFAGDLVTSREWYRPDPATGQLYWSSRNNVNYTEAAVLASLEFAANYRETLLHNFYQKGLNSINFSKANKTQMFVIPAQQRDKAMTAYLIDQLLRQGIEVHRVKASKDEYVVLLDQPYSRLAYDLLTEQKYPSTAKFPPYDAIAWTLGYLSGVDVQKSDTLSYSPNELELINEAPSLAGSVNGKADNYILKYEAQSSVISGLYEAAGANKNFKAAVTDTSIIQGNYRLKAGTIILSGMDRDQATEWAEEYGLDLVAGDVKPEYKRKIQLPRIAVYHSWTNTQAEGWVRYTLEQKGIPYTSINKDDLNRRALNEDFNVIIIPHQYGDLNGFINGVDDRFGPLAYTKTDEFPSHGFPDSSEDITGGPGHFGLNNLSIFVKNGGVLIPLDNSANIIADASIAKNVRSFSPGQLFHPGSIVTVKARNPKSPVLYGYPETFHLFKGNGKLLRTAKYDRDLMVLQYGTDPLDDEKEYSGKILGRAKMDTDTDEDEKSAEEKEIESKDESKYVLSGMVRNEKEIIGNAAILNVPVGEGHIVFFTFNPLNRYLNHYDSGLLWNTLINWNHL
ncbi:M14 family zinc carboxypeptidase [Maribellus mangrovi]|uniref:M14 family zinc carboxypeptidase n=1 Tax=Maribellus mangrovi TaxID=3133146 RepID=UPI0030EF475B